MAMSGPPSGRRGRARAPMADINVTPLVDVMLVLLIIFMVTAPLLVTGVPGKLPETRAKGLDQDAKPTVVSIDRDGGLIADTYWTYRRNNHTDFGSLLVANTVTGAASLFERSLLADVLPLAAYPRDSHLPRTTVPRQPIGPEVVGKVPPLDAENWVASRWRRGKNG